MKRVVAVLIALVFFASSAWISLNQSAVEAWLVDQISIEQEDHEALVGLQSNESWLVVVVDFENHPSTNGWGTTEAESLLTQAAVPYIEQLSGGTSTLTIEVHPTVVRAMGSLSDYGADGTGKDTDDEGIFLPMALAEEAVSTIQTEIDWNRYDLNDDGKVDRLLILHTSKGQEESPGIVNRIWSHFTHFDEPLDVSDGMAVNHYTMASLQTGSSGVGTMIHEMLHQMGAVDLYPVHHEGSFQSWKGPGDWDIMASGNWNGGGRWPALPTGANMELVAPNRIQEVDLVWPTTSPSPCIGPTIELKGTSQQGVVLKIPIAEHEYIFIEHRSDFGYDSRLPGHGVLVTYQDLSVGDFEQNELNTNPDLPWLKVVEADGRQDLVSGANQGEPSDLFLNNTSFGASGVVVRTHDGIQIPWTAHIQVEENSTSVSFTAAACNPSFTIDLPNHGAAILVDGIIPLGLEGAELSSCSTDLTLTDGRTVSLSADSGEPSLVFSAQGTANSISRLRGSLSCDDSSIHLDYPVQVLNRIPVESDYIATIDPYEKTTLTVPISSLGGGKQRLNVMMDGPLERVASTATSVDLDEAALSMVIEPNGLLSENMVVYGELVLMTEEGLAWTIDIELQATSESDAWWALGSQPSVVLALLFAFMGFYSLSYGKNKSTPQPEKETPTSPSASMDAWGRPIDEEFSAASLDVEIDKTL